mgnify:CR=1 FL=1
MLCASVLYDPPLMQGLHCAGVHVSQKDHSTGDYVPATRPAACATLPMNRNHCRLPSYPLPGVAYLWAGPCGWVRSRASAGPAVSDLAQAVLVVRTLSMVGTTYPEAAAGAIPAAGFMMLGSLLLISSALVAHVICTLNLWSDSSLPMI